MKRSFPVLAVLCLVALPAVGGVAGPIDDPDDPRDPHRALREAVEDIRIHCAPHAGFAEDLVLSSSGLNRAGLGILISGGWSFFRSEGEPGAEIPAVTPGSPAEEAGLRSGDVVVSWNGEREVKSPEHAMRILRSYEPDEVLTVDIVRRGRPQTLTGTVPESSFRFHYRFRSPGDDG